MAKSTIRSIKRLSPENRKAKILAVAREVLAEVQFENFLPSAVAERCGVSEGTIYRYFPTKQDLLVTLAEERLIEAMETEPLFDKTLDISTRLFNVILHSLKIIHGEPAITRFIFVNQRIDSNYRNTRLYKLVAQFARQTMRVVEDAINSGVFRDDIAITVIRDIIFGAVEHQMWPYLRSDPQESLNLEQIAKDISETVYRGLSKSAPINVELVSDAIARARTVINQLEDELNTVEKSAGIKK